MMLAKLPLLREKFRELYNQGATYDEIAEKLGISFLTAMDWRKKLGLPSRRSGPVSWMDERRIDGRSPREILKSVSKPLGLTDHDIEFILTRFDKLRSKGIAHGRRLDKLILTAAYMYLRWEGSGKRPVSPGNFVHACWENSFRIVGRELLMLCRLFTDAQLYPAGHLRPQQLLERWWFSLKSEYNLPDEVKAEALRIMEVPRLCLGRKPEVAVAGSLYVACERCGTWIGQQDLADIFGISSVAVRLMIKAISKATEAEVTIGNVTKDEPAGVAGSQFLGNTIEKEYMDKRLDIDTAKQKTTIVVEKKLWKDFLSFVVEKHGTTRKMSIEIESAIREYMNEAIFHD